MHLSNLDSEETVQWKMCFLGLLAQEESDFRAFILLKRWFLCTKLHQKTRFY